MSDILKIKHSYIILLIFTISLFAREKNKFELTAIEFSGNHAISTSQLLSVIYSKESPNWLSQFANKFTSLGANAVYFDSLFIPADIEVMKGLYQSKGFFKIKISAHYNLDTSNGNAKLFYDIKESSPAYFRSFVVNGLTKIEPEFQEQIYNYDKVDSSTVYEDAIVKEKRNFALTFLKDHGYMLVQVDKPSVVVDTVKNKVDVVLKITTGRRYQIKEILTTRTGQGFDNIDDNLLKDIVNIEPGSWYSYYEIQNAQVRLYRTNLFTSVTINSVYADTVGYKVPLQITADLGMMRELSPDLIMNNEDATFNFGFGLNFIKKNLFGGARKFTIGISAVAQNIPEFIKKPSFADSTFYGYADLRASIEQPFLFGKSINTKLEAYYTMQKRKDQYNSKIFGSKLSLDFELPQFTYVNSLNSYFYIEHTEFQYKRNYIIGLASQYYQLKKMSKLAADSAAAKYFDNILLGKLVSQATNAVIGANIGANKTNDIFFPTEGYALYLSLEEGNSIPFLFSKIFNIDFQKPLFLKTVLSTSIYFPVYESKVNAFGMKFKIGQIFTYRGDKANISLNQRLYAGGSNSVRGWATRQLVPVNEQFNLAENLTQEDLEAALSKEAATGGFFLMEGSIETRNRIVGRIGSALFLDYGNTWNGFQEFRFDEIAVAAGFGLRYYSDVIPIRIDFGIKVYDPNDHRNMFKKGFWSELFQFQIGIGEAF
jgi:outer membrane protein insertion porin family